MDSLKILICTISFRLNKFFYRNSALLNNKKAISSSIDSFDVIDLNKIDEKIRKKRNSIPAND
jgi:hypothetical protein